MKSTGRSTHEATRRLSTLARDATGEHANAAATPRAGGTFAVATIALALTLCGVLLLHAPEKHQVSATDALDRPTAILTLNGALGGDFHAAVARPATINKVVSCERLPHVPGKSITTVLVDFPPSAYSPAHRHPGSVTAYVLNGAIRSQLDGGAVGTFTQGDTFFEPPGTLHNFAENASDMDAAQLLATFITDNDCGPLTIPER